MGRPALLQRAEDDAERHEAVDARVVAVGDERRAVETPPRPQSHLSSELVAEKAECSSRCERPEIVASS